MHSNCSDGSDTPFELLLKVKDAGLNGLSITDHDTIAAYTPELFVKAQELGLELAAGVEFSSEFEGTTIHVLGYFFDIHSPQIQAFCERHKERRKARNIQMLTKLAQYGIFISREEIYENEEATIGRPHIAAMMVKKGYVESIQDAFNRYLGDGKPAYIKGESFGLTETISVVKEAGGKAVLAHPILISKKAILRKLHTFNFDGWECYYAKFSAKQNEEIVKIADKFSLIRTGGSDYHGAIKPLNRLGSAYTDVENFERLKAR